MSATKAQNRSLQSSLVKPRVENSAVTHARYALRTLFGNFIFVRFEARLESGATRVISLPRKLLSEIDARSTRKSRNDISRKLQRAGREIFRVAVRRNERR